MTPVDGNPPGPHCSVPVVRRFTDRVHVTGLEASPGKRLVLPVFPSCAGESLWILWITGVPALSGGGCRYAALGLTGLGLDSVGQLGDLVVDGASLRHERPDLAVCVHYSRVISPAELLPDLW